MCWDFHISKAHCNGPVIPTLGGNGMSDRGDEVTSEVAALLEKLQGVTIVNTQCTDKVITIEFTVSSPESRLLLTYCAEAANVKLHCWANHSPGSEEGMRDADGALHYRYQSSSNSGDGSVPTDKFEGLGAHLTWQMNEIGLLSADEEKRLAKTFGAISRSSRYA